MSLNTCKWIRVITKALFRGIGDGIKLWTLLCNVLQKRPSPAPAARLLFFGSEVVLVFPLFSCFSCRPCAIGELSIQRRRSSIPIWCCAWSKFRRKKSGKLTLTTPISCCSTKWQISWERKAVLITGMIMNLAGACRHVQTLIHVCL